MRIFRAGNQSISHVGRESDGTACEDKAGSHMKTATVIRSHKRRFVSLPPNRKHDVLDRT